MKLSLLLAGTAMAAALSAPASAATCTTVGLAVTCSGTVTGGFTNATPGIAVEVTSGATVSRANGDAIRVRGAEARVTNHGTIAGLDPAGSDGVDGGDSLTVTNHGTITATNKGIDADDKAALTVTNTGTIRATDKAIRNGNGVGATLTNAAEALIESVSDEGFESGDDAVVTNHGTIRASDDAVQVGENAWIENTGLIESVTRGGDEADPQDGIDIDSGTIINSGTIRSDDDAAIDYDGSTTTSFIANEGTISGTTGVLVEKGETGEVANVATQWIFNSGTIEGRNGLALDVGAGDDVLINTGTLIGGADFGTGDDTAAFGAMAGVIGGLDSLFDGGAGTDELIFDASLADLSLAWVEPGVLEFAFGETARLWVTNWEWVTFDEGTYALADLLAPAPVPVPAAGLLALGGIGALAALRRRR